MQTFGKDTTRIRVRAGEGFIVELPAAATAGFTWRVVEAPAIATLTQERIRPGGPGLGASSVQEFEFTATRAGASTLSMEYKRPWENVPGERLEIDIVVEP